MVKKRVNADQLASSQRAQQARARREKQLARGSPKFRNNSNVHIGGPRGESGQPRR
jgi:hypothetical protein